MLGWAHGGVGELLDEWQPDGAVPPFDDDALLRAAPDAVEDWHGLAIHRLLAGTQLLEVAAYGGEERDIDTWEDLRRERT